MRRELPGAFIVVGGHDASREPHAFLDPNIDAIAIGDGEEVMPPLVAALERGGDGSDVPGLALNRGGDQKLTGHAPTRRDRRRARRSASAGRRASR